MSKLTKSNSDIKTHILNSRGIAQNVRLDNEQMNILSDQITREMLREINPIKKNMNDTYEKLKKTNEFNKGIGKIIFTLIALSCIIIVSFIALKGGLTLFDDISKLTGLSFIIDICVEKSSENAGFFKFTWSLLALILYLLRFVIVIVIGYFGFSFAGDLFDKKRKDLDY